MTHEHEHKHDHHVEVRVITTAKVAFPTEGHEKEPATWHVEKILKRAAHELHLVDIRVTGWPAATGLTCSRTAPRLRREWSQGPRRYRATVRRSAGAVAMHELATQLLFEKQTASVIDSGICALRAWKVLERAFHPYSRRRVVTGPAHRQIRLRMNSARTGTRVPPQLSCAAGTRTARERRTARCHRHVPPGSSPGDRPPVRLRPGLTRIPSASLAYRGSVGCLPRPLLL